MMSWTLLRLPPERERRGDARELRLEGPDHATTAVRNVGSAAVNVTARHGSCPCAGAPDVECRGGKPVRPTRRSMATVAVVAIVPLAACDAAMVGSAGVVGDLRFSGEELHRQFELFVLRRVTSVDLSPHLLQLPNVERHF